MGEAKRRQARQALWGTLEIEVTTPGCLEILSVGRGDIKLSISTPEDIEDAKALIEDMLRKGYSIFVETDEGLARVHAFNPNRMTYVIKEVVQPELAGAPVMPALAAVKPDEIIMPGERRGRGRPKLNHPPRRTVDREIPVTGTKARAVGRTAGG